MKHLYFYILFTLLMTAHSFSQFSKPTFVFVHGAWFGSFAWKKVTPLLEAKGYKTIAIDLPGYGSDKRPSGTFTLNYYVQKVVDVENPLKEKVILVGHSMGGCGYYSSIRGLRP